jgi:DNA repair exonuclease SbcCD ATPase subunit
MNFILEQMARLAVSAQRNEDEHAQFTDSFKQLNKSVSQLSRIAAGMARRYRRDHGDLRDRISALIDAHMRSEERQSRAEERQSRTEEWQAQMEESFVRSDARMTRLEADAEHTRRDLDTLKYAVESHDDDIKALFLINESNGKDIAKLTSKVDKLAEIVAGLGRRRNGGEESA